MYKLQTMMFPPEPRKLLILWDKPSTVYRQIMDQSIVFCWTYGAVRMQALHVQGQHIRASQYLIMTLHIPKNGSH